MTQNRSNAVMATRIEPAKSLDDFPTPPWATRALLMKLAERGFPINHSKHVLEPAANRGFMVRPLAETGCALTAYDIHDYGVGYPVADFMGEKRRFDWIITNPPFIKAGAFWAKAMGVTDIGVALLCRSVFTESVGRYAAIFQKHRPDIIFQFTERVPMLKGRCTPMATTATAYAWFVWLHHWRSGRTEFDWIQPCRKRLERIDTDYEIPTQV